MTERFNKAINALVKAYFNDTLAKGTCKACAVGNIVADSLGLTISKNACAYHGIVYNCDSTTVGIQVSDWSALFITLAQTGKQHFMTGSIPDIMKGRLCIQKTGYNEYELAKVEYAFETNTNIRWDEYWQYDESEVSQDQYNGLMAVVDVLCEIEGIEDVAEYKSMFDKQLA